MLRNGPEIISCYPQFSDSKFPCDCRGGLRFTVRRRLAELLDLNMRHTTGKKSFLNTDRLVCHRSPKFRAGTGNPSIWLSIVYLMSKNLEFIFHE